MENKPFTAEEIEFIDFGVHLYEVAEKVTTGGFNKDEDHLFAKSLLSEYKLQGSPKAIKSWLRKRLASSFLWVEKPPVWKGFRQWPFLNGRPMVFITQWRIPKNEVTSQYLLPHENVYLFGAKVGTSETWSMEYKIVTQLDEENNVWYINSLDDVDTFNALAETGIRD